MELGIHSDPGHLRFKVQPYEMHADVERVLFIMQELLLSP